MPKQPGMEAPDTWSVYLATDNAQKTLDAATGHGGQVLVPAMPVADLGTMAMVSDAGGAAIGLWQPGLHKGFGVVAEEGAPGWFEVYTRDYDGHHRLLPRRVRLGHADRRRHARVPLHGRTHGPEQLAGIMDGSGFLPEGVPAHWAVYFGTMTPTPRWPRSPAWGARSSGPRRTPRTAGWPRRPTRPVSTSSSSPRTRPCPRGSPEPETRGPPPASRDRGRAAPRSGLAPAGRRQSHGNGPLPRATNMR